MSERGFAECLATELRPGYMARIWTKLPAGWVYSYRRITRVELRPGMPGEDLILVSYEGEPGLLACQLDERLSITTKSISQAQEQAASVPAGNDQEAAPIRVHAPCRYGDHLLHRTVEGAGWLDDSGHDLCPGRPYRDADGVQHAGHEPAQPERPGQAVPSIRATVSDRKLLKLVREPGADAVLTIDGKPCRIVRLKVTPDVTEVLFEQQEDSQPDNDAVPAAPAGSLYGRPIE